MVIVLVIWNSVDNNDNVDNWIKSDNDDSNNCFDYCINNNSSHIIDSSVSSNSNNSNNINVDDVDDNDDNVSGDESSNKSCSND